MSIVYTDNSNYNGIAAAIRAKLGVQTQYKPDEMAAAISTIDGGGTISSVIKPSNNRKSQALYETTSQPINHTTEIPSGAKYAVLVSTVMKLLNGHPAEYNSAFVIYDLDSDSVFYSDMTQSATMTVTASVSSGELTFSQTVTLTAGFDGNITSKVYYLV